MSFKSFSIDALVEDVAPSALTFDVPLITKNPDVEVILHFRSPKDYGELQQFNKEAVAWSKTIPKKSNTIGGQTEEWKDWAEFLPLNPNSIGAIFTISQLSEGWTVRHKTGEVETNPKLTYLDAAKLCKAPWTADYIIKAIDAESKSMTSLLMAAVDSKNDSRQMDESVPSSPSAGKSTASTRGGSLTRKG